MRRRPDAGLADLANPTMSPNLDYLARVNRAIDHVLAHLDQPLSLEVVAKVAAFSPFHFHRVFKALTGETLAAFVKRARLERALSRMTHQPDLSLTRVAIECGFASSSELSRSFRKRFGVPPSAFDVRAHREAHGEALRLDRLPPGENPDGFSVVMRDLPPRTVAYLRVTRPYEGTAVVDAAARLVQWAERRGCADGQWLGYQWDDPELVPLERCRYDVGVVVDEVVPEGEIGRLELPAMRVAELDLAGGIELEMRALDWLFGTWLPRSRFVPDDQPAFEAWNGRPFAHGTAHFELRVHLPVRDAGAWEP